MRLAPLLSILVLLLISCSVERGTVVKESKKDWYGLAIGKPGGPAGKVIAIPNMPRFPWQYGYANRLNASGPIESITLGTLRFEPPYLDNVPLSEAESYARKRRPFLLRDRYRRGIAPPASPYAGMSPADMLRYAAASLRFVESRLGPPTAVHIDSMGLSPFAQPLWSYQAYWAGRNYWGDKVVRANFFANVDCVTFTVRATENDESLLQGDPFTSQLNQNCRVPDALPPAAASPQSSAIRDQPAGPSTSIGR